MFPESGGSWNLQAEVERIQASFSADELRAKQAKFVRIIDELIARFQDRYEVIKAGTFENDGWTGTSTFRPPDVLIQSFVDACNDLGLSRHPMYWIVTPDFEVPEEVKPKGFWAEHVRIYDPHSGKGCWTGLVKRRWDKAKGRFVEWRTFDRKPDVSPYLAREVVESAKAHARQESNSAMLRLCQDSVLKLRAWSRAVAAIEPSDAIESQPDEKEKHLESGSSNRDDALPLKERKLAPSRMKAKAAYEWAMSKIPGAENMTITELWAAIDSHPSAASDCIGPNPTTFGKYLRDAGVKRYDTRGNRTGGSVRRRDEI